MFCSNYYFILSLNVNEMDGNLYKLMSIPCEYIFVRLKSKCSLKTT